MHRPASNLEHRCQIHKVRNVVEHLPEGCRADWKRRLRNAYAMISYEEAEAALEKLWRQLVEINPSAARSLEEGMEETLTLHRLGVAPLRRRSLSSTNLIESCLSTVRRVTRNVKRWRGGTHIARWTAAVSPGERLSGAAGGGAETESRVALPGAGGLKCDPTRAATFN